MPGKESDDFRWGTVLAKLEAIDEKTTKCSQEDEKATARFDHMHAEVTSALSNVTREITAFGQKLDSHIEEDDRRFHEHRGDIRRLEDNGGVPLAGKAVGVAGGGAGLVVLVKWLRDLFHDNQ